jgi:integrase
MADPNVPSGAGKLRPPKPAVKHFPLYAHATGNWCKKVDGDHKSFGRWGRIVNGQMTIVAGPSGALDGDWQAALANYNAWVETGGRPRDPETVTVNNACSQFYAAKQAKCDAGELAPEGLAEYDRVNRLIVGAFGRNRAVADLGPADFAALRAKMAKTWGLVKLGNTVSKVRTVFKWAAENDVIERPVVFGSDFVKPSKEMMRKHRASGGEKLFWKEEILQLMAEARPQLRAMLWLGINAAFGNTDCVRLTWDAVDLANGRIKFARPKTGVARCCPLWPETASAMADLPRKGKQVFDQARDSNAVAQAMCRLMRKLKINGRRGLGFYTLRHTFRTVADNTKDFAAIRTIMGHADGRIDDAYVESIGDPRFAVGAPTGDSRLRAVTDYVRTWLLAPPESEGQPTTDEKAPAEVAAVEPVAEARPSLRLFAG